MKKKILKKYSAHEESRNDSDAAITSAAVSYTHLDVYKRQLYRKVDEISINEKGS